jgi:hypothetical protein
VAERAADHSLGDRSRKVFQNSSLRRIINC